MTIFQNDSTLSKHLVTLTCDLIRFVSHGKENQELFALIDFLHAYFETEPVVIRSFVSGGLPSLLITFEETKHPQLLLSGHLDVVEASTRYEAEVKEGKLYGSGALDMKGGVACMLTVMKAFCKEGQKPSLGLILTSDEESGSLHGTPQLLNQEEIRADFVIVNEGRWRYDIVTREKGVLMLKVTHNSPGAHSAYPWKAKNPINEVMESLKKMQALFPASNSGWCSTFAITTFHAGKEFNTIPPEAEAVVNIRFTGGSEWSKEAILKKLSEVITADTHLEVIMTGHVFEQNQADPYVQLLQKIASKVKGDPMAFGENHGASDARFFHERGIPSVSLGPVGNFHHTNQEYVEVDSLVMHAKVLKAFIEQLNQKH